MMSAMRLGVLRTIEGIAEVDEAVRARSTKLKLFFVDFDDFLHRCSNHSSHNQTHGSGKPHGGLTMRHRKPPSGSIFLFLGAIQKC